MNPICDLHTHSVLSKHAYSSPTENIEYASSIGLKYYGISEHQHDDMGVGVHNYALDNLRVLPRKFKDTYVLRGVEYNILDDGIIDVKDRNVRFIDYGIASIHGYVYKGKHTITQNTDNYLKVLDNDLVTILGHIDHSGYPCDYEKIVQKVIEKHKLIELNNASLSPKGSRENAAFQDEIILKLLMKYNYPIIINSDAHIKYDIGDFKYANKLLDDLKFPKELILNYNEDLFKTFFDITTIKGE